MIRDIINDLSHVGVCHTGEGGNLGWLTSDGLTMAGLVSRCLEVHVVTRRSKSEKVQEEAEAASS